eukprot:5894068-Alexandrium_andersonii.AAC.1
MKYCSGNGPRLPPAPASTPSAPDAFGLCSTAPKMLNTSSRRGCRSSSMRGRSTPTASRW